MIATDIDGTIVKWGSEISPAVKNCINEVQKNRGKGCSCHR